jgi:hypothetical protein
MENVINTLVSVFKALCKFVLIYKAALMKHKVSHDASVMFYSDPNGLPLPIFITFVS